MMGTDKNYFQEMEEYNQMLKERAEAFKKLAKALNKEYVSHLTETRQDNTDTTDNHGKSKRNQKSV